MSFIRRWGQVILRSWTLTCRAWWKLDFPPSDFPPHFSHLLIFPHIFPTTRSYNPVHPPQLGTLHIRQLLPTIKRIWWQIRQPAKFGPNLVLPKQKLSSKAFWKHTFGKCTFEKCTLEKYTFGKYTFRNYTFENVLLENTLWSCHVSSSLCSYVSKVTGFFC